MRCIADVIRFLPVTYVVYDHGHKRTGFDVVISIIRAGGLSLGDDQAVPADGALCSCGLKES